MEGVSCMIAKGKPDSLLVRVDKLHMSSSSYTMHLPRANAPITLPCTWRDRRRSKDGREVHKKDGKYWKGRRTFGRVGDRHHLQCGDPAVEEKKIPEAAKKYKPISAAGGLEVPFLPGT